MENLNALAIPSSTSGLLPLQTLGPQGTHVSLLTTATFTDVTCADDTQYIMLDLSAAQDGTAAGWLRDDCVSVKECCANQVADLMVAETPLSGTSTVADAATCCALCTADSACNSWNFLSTTGNCLFYASATPATVTVGGYTTGFCQ
jgi:hypothetical protein